MKYIFLITAIFCIGVISNNAFSGDAQQAKRGMLFVATNWHSFFLSESLKETCTGLPVEHENISESYSRLLAVCATWSASIKVMDKTFKEIQNGSIDKHNARERLSSDALSKQVLMGMPK